MRTTNSLCRDISLNAMILIINGPLGVGKTTIAEALLHRYPRGVMLDGDAAGNVHPFEIYDPVRVAYLYRTLAMLVAWHQREGGYENVVIDYVFETPESLRQFITLLCPLDPNIHIFRLRAPAETLRARIRKRGRGDDAYLAWELQRGPELLQIQDENGAGEALGRVIETEGLAVSDVVDVIWGNL